MTAVVLKHWLHFPVAGPIAVSTHAPSDDHYIFSLSPKRVPHIPRTQPPSDSFLAQLHHPTENHIYPQTPPQKPGVKHCYSLAYRMHIHPPPATPHVSRYRHDVQDMKHVVPRPLAASGHLPTYLPTCVPACIATHLPTHPSI